MLFQSEILDGQKKSGDCGIVNPISSPASAIVLEALVGWRPSLVWSIPHPPRQSVFGPW